MSADDVMETIGKRDLPSLTVLINSYGLVELLETFQELTEGDMAIAFRSLSKDRAAIVFDALPVAKQVELVGHLDHERVLEMFTRLDPDDRVRLIEELPARVTKRLLNQMDPNSRDTINLILGYPENSAGRIMNPRYASARAHQTVQEVLERLRRSELRPDEIAMVYVIDADRTYRGHIRIGALVKADPGRMVSELASLPDGSIKTIDERDKARDLMMALDLPAIPVLDMENRLVGSITFDDVMDVMEEETTEDFHKMGTVEGVTNINIREAGLRVLYRARMPWLMVLVMVNIISGAGIAFFESAIEAVVALVFFLPLLIDSGGNAGSQASTLMVRAMATGDVHTKDWLKMLTREVKLALAIGATMGLAVSLLGLYRGGPEVAIVVTLSMVCVVLVGSLIGMLLPFVLARSKFDPATASAPLVTSMADIAGVFIYFGLASWYLGI